MFLSDINENQAFNQQVYVITATKRETKNGKIYLTGEVRDKSEVIKYNLWDTQFISALPKTGDYAEFKGRLENFKGTRQINLQTFKILDPKEINEENFKKTTILNLQDMWQELEVLCDSFSEPLVAFLGKAILQDAAIEKFKKAPAAAQVHSAWVSGLLEHSLAIAKLSDVVVSHYNELYFKNKINRDIVVFGSLFHDFGKIWEYDFSSPNISTTREGELLGHIYLGTKKMQELAQNFTGDVGDILDRILHIVLSHHGKYEFGAPVLPKTPEAIIVHFMDNIDTKLMNLWESLDGCQEEFTQRNFIQENARMYNIFKTDS